MSRDARVVLLSGGLDSYTAAAIAQADGFALYALTIRYGQRHAREIDAARARGAGARRRAASRARPSTCARIGGSSLTSDVAGAARPRSRRRRTFPSTYVPARNTIFLSLALGWAEVLGARDLVIGVNALDYSGYPDCRPEFIARVRVAGRRSRRAPASKARGFASTRRSSR